MKYLSGKNIYLRSLEKTDLSRTHTWLHEANIATKIGVKLPISISQQENWFEGLTKDSSKIVFAICTISNDEHIGNMSLDNIDLINRNARLSIFIANDNEKGKGIGSECLNILKKYCFSFLNLKKIYCKTDADDERVLRFYEKNGFLQEGLLKDQEFKNGEFVDKVLFASFNQSK